MEEEFFQCENFVLAYKLFAKLTPYEFKLFFFLFHMDLEGMSPLKGKHL